MSKVQTCIVCHQPIVAGVAVVGVVGGLFPVDDPDFFITDPSVMPEVYAHHPCFQARVIAVSSGTQER